MSWLVVLTELGIGVALIFGIATRYASLFTFVYLIIATAIAHLCVPKTSSADEFGAPARCRVAWRDFCRLGDMAIRKT